MKAKWLGEKLKIRRKALGLTMEELAERIGAGKGNIAIWEAGNSVPSGEYLALLCEELKKFPSDFFDITAENGHSSGEQFLS
jgi:transcriptional regulator with XRE-family HTH domain